MVLLSKPDYLPSPLFRCGHIQTLYPTLFRPKPLLVPKRERIATPDGDFIDLDWHCSNGGSSLKLAVVSHGLEGNSQKKYPLGMANHLTGLGWDVICWNFRGCSGEMNRLPRFYHSGVTDDLHTVLTHGLHVRDYRKVALIGFSMGGNQTLKYLGENPDKVPREVAGAVAFSVPCDLAASSRQLEKMQNRAYMHYFMRGLKRKIQHKAQMFPELLDTKNLFSMRTFFPFDDKYTAPLHGFSDAMDYYSRCSSNQFLKDIQIPTLLVQAADDPFLDRHCYPVREAGANSFLQLEIPKYGGHVGFVLQNQENRYWSEERAACFLENLSRT